MTTKNKKIAIFAITAIITLSLYLFQNFTETGVRWAEMMQKCGGTITTIQNCK